MNPHDKGVILFKKIIRCIIEIIFLPVSFNDFFPLLLWAEFIIFLSIG